MDFTLKAYARILDAIIATEIPVYTIEKWIINPGERGVLMRHDVDRMPKNALKMAQLEAEYGIRSTYYFRIGNGTFKPKIITRIADLGHEIGYHYEDLSLANGNYERAIVLFEKHLTALRNYAVINTIAMHGRPLSKHDNRDLWNRYDYKEYGIIGEAFLSIDYTEVYYFTDTGRNWSHDSVNLRDTVNTNIRADIKSTQELAGFIKKSNNQKISIVAHPERWNDNALHWLVSKLFDMNVNIAKHGVRLIRHQT